MNLDSHSNKKVLITGVNSFTGRHLKQYLEQAGFCVSGTVHKEPLDASTFVCDILDKKSILHIIKDVKPDYVIHLAGISFVGHPVIEDFYKVNVIGTQNLLEAIAETGFKLKKIILASSATVYGNLGLEVLDESICPQPANHYGMSKLAMEHVARTYFDKLPIIVTRPFNYIGIGQSENFVIPKIVSHFKQSKKVIELGNIGVKREFNDVLFVCEAYKALLEVEGNGQIVNLCSGKGVALQMVIDTLNEISGYQIDVQVNPKFVRLNELPKLVGSPDKLYSLVGPLEGVSLQKTLSELYLY